MASCNKTEFLFLILLIYIYSSTRVNFPFSTQVFLVYALTAVHNLLNMYDLDDLNNYGVIEDEEINKEDA